MGGFAAKFTVSILFANRCIFTDVDRDIIQGIGGTEDTHSFTRITETEINTEKTSEFENEPCIIRHSAYHSFEDIVFIL